MKRLRMDMLKSTSILYVLSTNSFQQGASWTAISASGESFSYTDSFKVNCAFPPPPLFYALPRLCYVTLTCDWLGAFTLCFARTAVVFPWEIILKH